jgi:hypothetical protein
MGLEPSPRHLPDVASNEGILLANPEISFYCTIKKFIIDLAKLNDIP